MGMDGGGVAGRPGRHTNSVYDMSGTFCFLVLEYAYLYCLHGLHGMGGVQNNNTHNYTFYFALTPSGRDFSAFHSYLALISVMYLYLSIRVCIFL